MKFTATAAAVLLSSGALATSIPSSYYSDMTITGSLYSYDSNAACDQIFYQSGACGLSEYFASVVPSATSGNLVAISASVFDQFGEDQHNTLCGKTIEITGTNGVTQTAIIADRATADIIDMCETLWVGFGNAAESGTQVPGYTWKLSE